MRAVPAMAGAFTTYGVAAEHAEPIALGVALGAVTLGDILVKLLKSRSQNG